jgi:hypothetical protein
MAGLFLKGWADCGGIRVQISQILTGSLLCAEHDVCRKLGMLFLTDDAWNRFTSELFSIIHCWAELPFHSPTS